MKIKKIGDLMGEKGEEGWRGEGMRIATIAAVARAFTNGGGNLQNTTTTTTTTATTATTHGEMKGWKEEKHVF